MTKVNGDDVPGSGGFYGRGWGAVNPLADFIAEIARERKLVPKKLIAKLKSQSRDGGVKVRVAEAGLKAPTGNTIARYLLQPDVPDEVKARSIVFLLWEALEGASGKRTKYTQKTDGFEQLWARYTIFQAEWNVWRNERIWEQPGILRRGLIRDDALDKHRQYLSGLFISYRSAASAGEQIRREPVWFEYMPASRNFRVLVAVRGEDKTSENPRVMEGYGHPIGESHFAFSLVTQTAGNGISGRHVMVRLPGTDQLGASIILLGYALRPGIDKPLPLPCLLRSYEGPHQIDPRQPVQGLKALLKELDKSTMHNEPSSIRLPESLGNFFFQHKSMDWSRDDVWGSISTWTDPVVDSVTRAAKPNTHKKSG